MQPLHSTGHKLHILSAFALTLVGTVNLWKVQSLNAAVPLDLTAISVIATATAIALTLATNRLRTNSDWLSIGFAFALFIPGAIISSQGSNPYADTKVLALFTTSLLVAVAPTIVLTSSRMIDLLMRYLAVTSLAISLWLMLDGRTLAVNAARTQIEDANPIALGRMACIGLVIFAIQATRSHTSARLGSGLAAGTCLVAAVLTGSRGPLFAAIVAILVTALLVTRSSRARTSIVAGGLCAAASITAIAIAIAPRDSIDRFLTGTGGASDVARIELANISLSAWTENPGGIGWGQFSHYVQSAATFDGQGFVQYPHNLFIEALLEGGPLALASILALLFYSVKRVSSVRHSAVGATVFALLILSVGSAMTSSDIIGNRFLWLMIGTALATGRSLSDRDGTTPRDQRPVHGSQRGHHTR